MYNTRGATLVALTALCVILAAARPAAAQCESASFSKSHTWDDRDGDSALSLGDVLRYAVTFCEGTGDRFCAFDDAVPAELTLDPASVLCTTDPGSPVPDTCAESPAGSGVVLVDYTATKMKQNQCVTLEFDATVTTAPTDPVCNQAVNVNVPTDLSDEDCQTVVAVPDLEIAKTALTPQVPPMGTVDFEITVHNFGLAPLVGGVVTDTLDACFEPLGVAGAPCDPAVVRCAGAGCAGATCTYAAGGLGFTFDGLALEPDDGAPGGDDEVFLTVTATAGATPGLCRNEAETSDPDSPSLTASDTVDITTNLPDLEITKTALTPLVPPGGTAWFEITIHNVGPAALIGGRMSDLLEPCFEPFGAEGDPCDPLLVDCGGRGCRGATCVYTDGGLGFEISGFDLDPDDGAPGGGDEITITVAATAGAGLGLCTNDAVTSDPDSPSITDGDTVEITNDVPNLAMTKTALSPSVPPGGSVDFEIAVANVGGAPLVGGSIVDLLDPCFEPLGLAGDPCDPAVVACTGPPCAGTTCVYSGGGFGFTLSGFDLAADDGAPGGADEILVNVTAVAGLLEGDCTNTVESSDPDTPALVAADTVAVRVPVADLDILKLALDRTVPPGGTTAFEITVRNFGDAPMVGGVLTDVLDACFEPLGVAAAPCDPAAVACAGAGCGGTTCTYGAAGLGFVLDGFTLAPDDGAAGGDDELVVTVTVTAGLVEQNCRNTAETSDPDSPSLTSDDGVDIASSAPCNLMDGDVIFPPRTPPLTTLYAAGCGAADPRLDRLHTFAVGPGDLVDDFMDAAGTLRLYQIECGCTAGVYLYKNQLTGKVAVDLF